MGSTIKLSMLLAGAGLLFSAGAAQAAESDVIHVRVPFSFVVKGETMPAGQYQIERDTNDPSVLLIHGIKNDEAMVVTTIPATGADPAGSKPAVTFTRDEGQYHLSKVWEPGEDGHALVR